MKILTSAIALALAVALSAPAQAAGSTWSIIGVWGGSSDVMVAHGQGGTDNGALTLVGDSDKVNVTGVQANGSKFNLQGTAVLGSNKVNVTTFQDGKNNIAGTIVVASDKTSVYTEQTSDNNLSVVGVVNSSDVDVTVVQGTLVTVAP